MVEQHEMHWTNNLMNDGKGRPTIKTVFVKGVIVALGVLIFLSMIGCVAPNVPEGGIWDTQVKPAASEPAEPVSK